MTISLRFIKALLFLCMFAMLTLPAHAQTAGVDQPTAGATPGGVNSGSASDAELWRQIRRGNSGTVVGGDKSGGMMIQSGGQDWRLMRNGPLPKYVAWAILGMLLLLSLFFALRGRMKVHHGLSGTTIKRFSLIERVGHWLLASSFILLSLTGLNLLFGKALIIPLLGKETFASITVFGKFVHNYVAFAFILGLIMITVMWIWHNIPSWNDVKWLARAGGMLGGGHPPAKKFNAGQKIIFWVVVLCGISISMSGWALMNPFTTNMFGSTFAIANDWFGTSYATDLAPIEEQQYQSLWHTIMAAFMIVVILAHIYIGSIGMQGALPAMTTGEVDTNWAREHHSLWVEDEEAKNWGKPKPKIVAKTNTDVSVSGQTGAAGSPSARLAGLSQERIMDAPLSGALPKVDSASDSMPLRNTRSETVSASSEKSGAITSHSEAVLSKKTAPAKAENITGEPVARQPKRTARIEPSKRAPVKEPGTVTTKANSPQTETPKKAAVPKRAVSRKNADTAKSTAKKTGATRKKGPARASSKTGPKIASASKTRDVQKAKTVTRRKTTSPKPATPASRSRKSVSSNSVLKQSVAGGMAVVSGNTKPRSKNKMTPRARAMAKAASERGDIKTTSKPVRRKSVSATAKSKSPSKPATRRNAKSTARDDLKIINGIGPQNEKKLNAVGVMRFADVAKWTRKQQKEFGERLAFPGRIEREEWVKQAKVLARSAMKD